MSDEYEVTYGEEAEPNGAYEPVRERVIIEPGSLVTKGKDIYRISQVMDFEQVVALSVDTGRSAVLRIGDLRPYIGDRKSINRDLAEIGDEDWRIAEQRFAAIKPLVGRDTLGREKVEQQAKEVGVDPATLYRWINQYNAYGFVSALIPKKRGWRKGKDRISSEPLKVIEGVVEDFYLTPQRPTAQKTVLEVQRKCMELGIDAPGPSAIRLRIKRLSEKQKLRGRGFKEKAKNNFLPAAGKFPNADYPLAVVQIDHTPMDIILVDDIHRMPIGRPWITLSIDVCTRIVTGYYLSFDPPSETSVALCVAHSLLPKEDWLILHNVKEEWPVWGVPVTIHVDNGSEFRSNNFRNSCFMHGINLEFRPVKQPRYGGHIERLLGTFMKEIHDLPGTTFSSIREREGYDSEKNAAITKSEFESWLVTYICKVYHRRLHSELDTTPMRKWELGIFGNSEVHGVGVPPRVADGFGVMLDFMPAFWRTVQTFGVTIDAMSYYAEALRPWINAKDPQTGSKIKCIFRRDPRDISSVWFFDPTLKHYFKIPLADQGLPAMSLWEFRQAREKLKREGKAAVDERQILQAITELRSKVDESQARTKKARRMAQRRREHEKKVSPVNPLEKPSARQPSLQKPAGIADLIMDDNIDDFGDIA